jgi:RimJ/RimL family protein N-acetyltransferase
MKQIPTIFCNEDTSLRSFRTEDALALASQANNPKIATNLRDVFPSPYQLSDAEWYIEKVLRGEFGYTWAISFQDQLAGSITLTPQTDVYRHSAEIGYWLGEAFWNKGIATASVGLVCRHAFEQLGLHRIFAGIFAGNEGSKAVLIKNGFQLEGIKKKAVLKNNQLFDEHFMALIKC